MRTGPRSWTSKSADVDPQDGGAFSDEAEPTPSRCRIASVRSPSPNGSSGSGVTFSRPRDVLGREYDLEVVGVGQGPVELTEEVAQR